MTYRIIQRRKIWYTLSGLLMVVSIVFVALGGIRLGIDFTGGTLQTLSWPEAPVNTDELRNFYAEQGYGDVRIQSLGEDQLSVRMRDLTDMEHTELLNALRKAFPELTEESFEIVGPVLGRELQRKALIALTLVIIGIVLYVSFAFRKSAQGPLRSWVYGLGAIAALVHDVIIVVGVFAALGLFLGVEVGTLFVTALLTILGFSVHDTIVVYDRVRENIRKGEQQTFADTVNVSVNNTIIRSLNTSITTLLVLLALYLFGGASIQYFVLALIAGVVIGTYSSIFLASPLLVSWYERRRG